VQISQGIVQCKVWKSKNLFPATGGLNRGNIASETVRLNVRMNSGLRNGSFTASFQHCFAGPIDKLYSLIGAFTMLYVSELYSSIGSVTMLYVSELYCTELCSNCAFHIVATVRRQTKELQNVMRNWIEERDGTSRRA
jgi:hypothetical protein